MYHCDTHDIYNTQRNDMLCLIFYCYAECDYAECRYAECRGATLHSLLLCNASKVITFQGILKGEVSLYP